LKTAGSDAKAFDGRVGATALLGIDRRPCGKHGG